MSDPARAISVAGYAALLAVTLAVGWAQPPYDDAFFFRRFALNWLDHGVFAWNPADGPVHGNTSQLFQGITAALAALTRDYTQAATRALSACCLLLGAAALGRRWPGGRPAIALAFLSPVALGCALSGMETAAVIALAALFVASLERGGARPIALAWALYLARPDTAILTLGALALRPLPWRARGRDLAACGAGLAAILLALWAYYGSALPLSFYVKSGASGLYDPDFLARSHAAKLRHAGLFALTACPLVAAAAAERARAWRLAAPALAFAAYHLLLTVDVMGLRGRFYAPCLPALAAAAAAAGPARRPRRATWRGLAALAAAIALAWPRRWLPTDAGWSIGRVPWTVYAGLWLTTAAALAPGRWGPRPRIALALAATAGGVALAGPLRAPTRMTDTDYARALAAEVTSWRGLERLRRCLGPRAHVYHSEIGVPGALLPEGRITDLGGLMNAEVTLGGADVDALCLRDRPDAVFLPHKNYARLNAQLRAGRCLEGYTRVVERGSSPLYVRADLAAAYACEAR